MTCSGKPTKTLHRGVSLNKRVELAIDIALVLSYGVGIILFAILIYKALI